jgi:hypothetical protein
LLLHFLEPIWLWASTAMLIPVIIHLWHVREGRRLKIGSVAFLETSTKQRSNNRIPRDLLLLLLRCLMILLIAFLLARPVFSSNVQKTAKGWVLLDRSTMKSAIAQYPSQLDSFRRAEMEFHFFEQGFPLADLSAPAGSDSILPSDYRALASMLEEETNAETYKVFVPLLASNFRGKNSVLSKVSWYPVSTSDSTSAWIADAWLSGSDSVRIIRGSSTSEKVDYSVQVIAVDGSDPEFEIINKSTVRLRNKPEHETAIGKGSLNITLISERSAPDSRYLRSALEAIAAYTGKNFVITEAEPAGFKDNSSDWVFWLSTSPLPANKAATIFQYRSGNPLSNQSWILDGTVAAGTVALNKYIPYTSKGEKVWTDGMGNAILSGDQVNNQTIYRFSTRFLPAWSGLPWSEKFPAMMMGLLFNKKDKALRMHDRRQINEEVLLADTSLRKQVRSAVNSTGLKDVSMNVWIALLVCFLAERMLAWYYQKITAHGG